jgi:solute:Na+ symporter, SSS family
MKLTFIDWTIMVIYFVFVLGIGFALKRYMKTSTDFFLSGRSIPAWITGLAFISANLGAQEVIGMGASGAKYGIATSHFYWIGAILLKSSNGRPALRTSFAHRSGRTRFCLISKKNT